MHVARVSRTARTIYVSDGMNARAAAALAAYTQLAERGENNATRNTSASGCDID